MIPMPLRDVAAAIGASAARLPDAAVADVCTDTRKGCAGAVFFALRGENSDGHLYVGHAERAGALAAVVERPVRGVWLPLLMVDDTLKALGDLARRIAAGLDMPRVAVTGSVGKTSVRAMTAWALGARYSVCESERNHNNEIGVPMTVFRIGSEHTAAVIEMAMRGMGQIAYLADIVRPTMAIVTNIGMSHIELLGSRERIAEAKAEVLGALPADGVAILPKHDAFFDYLRLRCPCRVLTFGPEAGADFDATQPQLGDDGVTRFAVNGHPFEIRSPGVHHAVNTAAACAAASALGISLDQVAERLAEFSPPDMRMVVREAPGCVTVLDDTYNAAPDSMLAALASLKQFAARGRRRTVAVLGDMKELGEHSAEAHRRIGSSGEAEGLATLVTVGPEAARIADAAAERASGLPGRIERYGDAAKAAEAIAKLVLPGDVVLVKGSRAMEMERIVAAIMQRDTDHRVP